MYAPTESTYGTPPCRPTTQGCYLLGQEIYRMLYAPQPPAERSPMELTGTRTWIAHLIEESSYMTDGVWTDR